MTTDSLAEPVTAPASPRLGDLIDQRAALYAEIKTAEKELNAKKERLDGYDDAILEMLDEAVLQFGADHVATYLGIEGDPSTFTNAGVIRAKMRGSIVNVEAGMVFSRFLSYLRYVELPGSTETIPEMSWFVG